MTWAREMGALLKQWWQIEKDYRASMRELRRVVKAEGRRLYEERRAK